MSFPCELSALNDSRVAPLKKKQRTLQRIVSAAGVGLFSGEKVSIRLCPTGENTGIVFQRIDLPHRPILPARSEYVQGTPRCTIIGNGKETVQTVEHLLAAVRAYGIDNILIEISGSEVPIFDGSSRHFVEMIEEAGICELDAEQDVYRLKTPIFWSQGDIHLIALPSEEYRISYTLHYPHSKTIGTQFYTFALDEERFKNEIASCRTFSIYEEIAPMIEKGLVKGGSLDNAVIIKGDEVINPGGLRFPDEMARHKVLDLIGDLSLVPPFLAHVVAVRSGHASNNAFAKQLLNHIKMENS
ncbi:MAG: UDP-3-O-[3-hydroxymyristoyl] N-acetylglucosamine deacetylase [Verrucomicrobia bacterium]|nr:UDP-3-O-[3-hydroxymyristoyl] N-acetylglucosamine deacetylase [Verrucomicrobiota bacterium]